MYIHIYPPAVFVRCRMAKPRVLMRPKSAVHFLINNYLCYPM